jgi:hypothetical protein
MKIYRVTINTDGETTKKPGEVSTEIIRTEIYFVAKSIGDVFNAAMKHDGEITDIMEVIPGVIVLE